MRTIRGNCFETNSSSTHSIVISNDNKIKLPKKAYFGLGEFGWEYKKITDTCSYFYTAIVEIGYYSDIRGNSNIYLEKLKHILEKHNIEYEFEKYDGQNAYIDHGDVLTEFIEELLENEDKLLRFLFSKDSFIFTGNDNDQGYYIEESDIVLILKNGIKKLNNIKNLKM